MSEQQTVNSRPRRWRRILMVAGPSAALVVIASIYLGDVGRIDTENAYVKAPKAAIASTVSGPIARVAVNENEPVEQGEVLFRIDREPYRLALQRRRAALRETHNKLAALKARYQQKREQLELARTDLEHYRRRYRRNKDLANRQMASEARLDDARHARDAARQRITVLQKDLQRILAQLDGNAGVAVEQHPRFLRAKSALAEARLNLEHTRVRAPFNGIASKVPEHGEYVRAGRTVMSVIGDERLWVEANFKETAITHLETGQPVEIRVDTYPGRSWRGRVESISRATGSEFSVLPQQNATGNWVKVVQRIPVRIALGTDGGRPVLRAGMSAHVTVDTGQRPEAVQAVAAVLEGLDRPKGIAAASASPR